MPRRNIPVRNPVAQSPLLRKGGVHIKSKTGQRVRARLSTNSAIDEWHESIEAELEEDNHNQEQENGEQMLPDFFSFPPQCSSSLAIAGLLFSLHLLNLTNNSKFSLH